MKKFFIYGLIAALLAGVLSLAPVTREDNVQSYSVCFMDPVEVSEG